MWDAPKGSSTERGYGSKHQAARRLAIAKHQPWHPCTRCGRELGTDTRQLHLDHSDDRRSYTGLAHAACNISAGARRGAQVANARRRWARPVSQQPVLRRSQRW